MADDNLCGTRQHVRGPVTRPAQLLLAAGARHFQLALQLYRQERVGSRGLRPRLIVQASDPEMRVVEPDRFQHAENLHARGLRA